MKVRLYSIAILAGITAALISAPAAMAAPVWAPVHEAPIRPGALTATGGGQCSANFIFYDSSNNVYIGQAAHCSGTGAVTNVDGCSAPSLPEGTQVAIAGASRPGTMVYNSWIRMQEKGEMDPAACAFNDFALILIDPADAGRVNPTVPFWGGPTGLATAIPGGEPVFSFGNSFLGLSATLPAPRQGVSFGPIAGGWAHSVLTVLPGLAGDSGSAFLNGQGAAFGVLSSLVLLPEALTNIVGDLPHQLEYMRLNSPFDVTLANGTEPFVPTNNILGGLLSGLGLGLGL